MVEKYTTEAFEKRKSQNLGFFDYAKSTLLWAVLPIAAAATTFSIGRLTKNKFFPLDGSPTLLQHIYESGYNLVTKTDITKLGVQGEVTKEAIEIARLQAFTGMIQDPKKQLAVTRDVWNAAKGLEIGAIPVAYHFWRNHEKQRLDLVPIHDKIKKLDGIKPSDAELAAENASLKQQLVFGQTGEVPGLAVQAATSTHEGKIEQKSVALQA